MKKDKTETRHTQTISSQANEAILNSTTTTTIHPEFIIRDPYLSEYIPSENQKKQIKVLLITTPSVPNKGHSILEKCLSDCIQQSHDSRAPDLVITPEHWISSGSCTVPPSQHSEVMEIARVLSRYHCYGFIGMTLVENVTNSKNSKSFSVEYQRFNVVTVINPKGQVLGVYKKRHPTAHETALSIGDRVGIFDTIYGRIAVLICFDIESENILQETLLYQPKIIVNPTFIGGGGLFDSNLNLTPQDAERSRYFQIKTSLEAFGRNFEKTCVDSRVTIIRCDTAVMSGGRGTHQLMTPYSTIYPPSFYRNMDFCFYVDLDVNENDFSHETAAPPRDRSDQADNVGARYVMYSNERQRSVLLNRKDVVHEKDVKVTTTTTTPSSSSLAVNPFGVKFYGHNKYICHDQERVALVNADVLFCNEELDRLNIYETFGAFIEDIFVRFDKKQLLIMTSDHMLRIFTLLDDELKLKACNKSFLKFEKQFKIPLSLEVTSSENGDDTERCDNNKHIAICRKFCSFGKSSQNPTHLFIYSSNGILRVQLTSTKFNNREELISFDSSNYYVNKTSCSQQEILTLVDYEESTQTLYFLLWNTEKKNELLLASKCFGHDLDIQETTSCMMVILSSVTIDNLNLTKEEESTLIQVQKTLERNNEKHFVITFRNKHSSFEKMLPLTCNTHPKPSLHLMERPILLPQPCTCVLPLNLSQYLAATVEGELLLLETTLQQQQDQVTPSVRHHFHRIPIHKARRILSMHFNEMQGCLVMFHEDATSEGVYQSLTRFGTNRFVADLSNFFV